jgi:hypothetical protein
VGVGVGTGLGVGGSGEGLGQARKVHSPRSMARSPTNDQQSQLM